MVECELKLVASAADLLKLARSPAVERRALGAERTDQLESIYYDTPDRQLAAQDLALRVRRVDGRYVQTLKHGQGVVRGEWEMALEDAAPDPGSLFEMAGLDGLQAIGPGDLVPVLTTTVERRLRQLRLNGPGEQQHVLELALDTGELTAGDQRAPVAEVELELLEGDPYALYDLALELAEQAPFRIETLSKAARGALLQSGAAPGFQKALGVQLDEEATVDEAMSRIFTACYDQWLANQAAALDGRDSEGVHQLRVAVRRLRSAFALFKQALPPAQLAEHQDRARAVLQCLGRARDLDVLVEQLLAPVRAGYPDGPGLAGLAERLEAARRVAYEQEVRPGLTSATYTRAVLSLGSWIGRRGWRVPGTVAEIQSQTIADFSRSLLDRRLKTVRKRGRNFDRLDAGERHRLRIAIKKLRYALDFCRSLYPRKGVKTTLRLLGDLQDHLGATNDLAVARQHLDRVLGRTRGRDGKDLAGAAGFLLGWHSARASGLEAETRRLWRRFKREAPVWHG